MQVNTLPYSGWSRLTLCACLAVILAGQSASATYTCDTSLGNYYSYCVNVPDGASSSTLLPTILFLSGSGARNSGSSSNVKSLSGYDGFGKKINEYLSGNKGADQTMAATQFITIIPISPMNDGNTQVRHWWPQDLDQVVAAVKAKYPIDEDRLHCVGYSMGARGCWRYATNRPQTLASTSSHAGAAESVGDSTLSQQAAPATFPLLNLITTLPVWQFDGSQDTTAGTAAPIKTQQQLVKLGSKVSQLSTENTDHSGMSTVAYDTTLMNWMLKQKRSGSSSQSLSGSISGSSSMSTSNTTGIPTVDGSGETESSNGVSASSTNTSVSLGESVSIQSAVASVAASAATGKTGKCASKRRSKRSHAYTPAHGHIAARGLTLDAILKARDQAPSSKLAKRSTTGLR